MAIVAVSKNKRAQVLFRTTPPLRPTIIIAFDHEEDLDDSIFLAQVVDESLDVEVGDQVDLALEAELEVVFDDTGIDGEVCG